MYITSNEYKIANLQADRKFESNILIGNRILTNEDLISFTIEQSIQQDDTFSIGNTISSCLNLMFLHSDIETDDKDIVNLKLGLLVNEEYEYVPLGVYNISNIDTNDTTTTLLCFDNMIKFDIAYKENAENPTLHTIINRLSELTGIQFAGALTDYKDYSLSVLENYSCREVLGFVAGVLGCNAIINRQGKFDFVSITGKASQLSIDYDGYYDYTKKNKNYILKRIVNTTDLEEISVGTVEENTSTLQLQNPFINETILQDLYTKLNNLEFLPYSLNWNGDIALDLGDLISITDRKEATRVHPILSQSVTFNGALNVTLGAQGETKTINETNSNTSEENEIIRVGKKVVQVQKDAGELYVVVYDEENQSSISLTEKMLEAIADEINLTANNINLEGLVTANDNFKILLDGSIEAVNGKFTGDIEGSDINGGTLTIGSTTGGNYFKINEDGSFQAGSVDQWGYKATITYGNSGFYIKAWDEANSKARKLQFDGSGFRIGDTVYSDKWISIGSGTFNFSGNISQEGSFSTTSSIKASSNVTAYGHLYLGTNSSSNLRGYTTSGSTLSLVHLGADDISKFGYGSYKENMNSYFMGGKYSAVIANNYQADGNGKAGGAVYLCCNGAYPSDGGLRVLEFTKDSNDNYIFRHRSSGATKGVYLGSASFRWYKVYSNASADVSSDRTLKENIKYIQGTVSNYNADTCKDISSSDMYNFIRDDLALAKYNYIGSTETEIGFIAQDLIYNLDGTENKIGNYIVDAKAAREENRTLSYNTGNYMNVIAGALKKAIEKIEKLEEVINERN